MVRITARLAAMLFGLALATSAAAVPVETTTALNLRAGPGVGNSVLTTMPAGVVVDLRGCDGVWCVVAYRGRLGWANGRYLARIPFRPQRGPRIFDFLSPDREVRGAPPPPAGRSPRVIEAPEPAPSRQARTRPEASAPERPASAPPADSGVLRGASPTVSVPRDQDVQETGPERTAAPPTGRAPAPGPETTASSPADAADTGAAGEETEAERRLRLRRNAPTGGSGADVL